MNAKVIVMIKQLINRFQKKGESQCLPGVGLLNLGQAPCGARFRICQLCGNASHCQKLRELGFCEDTEVEVLNRSGAILCQIFGSRVGLSSSLARNVIVSPANRS